VTDTLGITPQTLRHSSPRFVDYTITETIN
jgi:hypothetical protein